MLCAETSLHADWVANGTPVCDATYGQHMPKSVSDGAGGAIIAWADARSTAPSVGIYAQRIDGYGNALWTTDGVALYANIFNSYYYPEISSDGAGGAIVVWRDDRNGEHDLFAQRVDASGATLWGTEGVTISDAPTVQRNYRIVSGGSGGAIIAWQDSSSGSADIYAQKIDASGAAQWAAGGVAICTNAFEQHEPCIETDGLGGAFIAWDDHRGGPTDLYAQRIKANGTVAWTANGIVICNAANAQEDPCMVSDDLGGVTIAWRDYRNSADWLIYAQRISGSGSILYAANGVLANTTAVDMYQLAIGSDSNHGAIIAWTHFGSSSQDLYAQRINYLGYRDWAAGGVAVCTYAATQSNPVIVPDGNGGAVIAWDDYRPGTQRDIYAQKLSEDGVPKWTVNGRSVCTDANDQLYQCIASDGAGGAVIAWEDYRPGSSSDIYAMRIERNGYYGYPAPTITSVLDVPEDQGGHVTVTWSKSILDIAGGLIVDRYSLWRMLPTAQLDALLAAGAKGVDTQQLAGTAPGTIFISKASGAATGWELLSYVDANVSATYSADAATLFDSTEADPGLHSFMVIAHGTDQFDFWMSLPDSGWSVDNLGPAQPLNFAAEQSFEPIGLILTWGFGMLKALGDDDFSHYALYRGTARAFVPGPGNCIYLGPDTTYFDGDWRWSSGFYYKLSAFDVHGNESTFGVVTPDDVTGTDTPEAPIAAYLAQNAPNPFNPSTTISFGVASPGRVTLSIYDVSGRLVRTLVDEPRSAGLYRQNWDGRNAGGAAVSSGVYFYRLRAGTFLETKKMVLAR
jgi:hypothetical protein